MNFPRSLRYKRENILLVGIIPGPHEPSHDINSYLDPLVKEVLYFWDGIHLDVHGCHKALVRFALLCLACDLPAGRKVGGFLGHSAHLGCSRCLKHFVGRVGEMDYYVRVGHLKQERDTGKMPKLCLLATPRWSWKDLNLILCC